MAKKTKVSTKGMKKAGKRAVSGARGSYTEIKVCELDDCKVHASQYDYYIWLNSNTKDCVIDFGSPNKCPLDECKFTVPGGSAAHPGRYPTKAIGSSGTYPYCSPCCPDSKQGQPKVIID